MNGKQIFDRHYRRLLTEGILKSVICGAAVGFGISFIFSFLYWMLAFGNIWIGIVIGIASGILTGALAYRLRYNPTDKTIARRIDRYGLEERMIYVPKSSVETYQTASYWYKYAKSITY